MNAACVTTQQSARLTHEGPGLAKKPSPRYTSTARGIDSDVQLSSLVKQPMYTHNHWPAGQCTPPHPVYKLRQCAQLLRSLRLL